MTEQSRPSAAMPAGHQAAGPKETGAPATSAKAVAGPLTIRDLMVLGAAAIIFVASVVPVATSIGGNFNLWNTSGLFYIGIGIVLPLVVAGLFLVRRMSPGTHIRVGSLSIDQFASVVAVFASYFFFVGTVSNFAIAFLIGLIGSVVLLVATVCAQWLPVLAADFSGRAEVPAHLAARDAVAALKRPAAPKPVVAQGAQTGAGRPQFGQQQVAGPAGQAAPGAQSQYVPGTQGAPTPASGQNTPASGQNTPASGQSAPAQGGWNSSPTAGAHTQAGQVFTPAKAAGAAATAAATTSLAAAAPAASAAAATANPAASVTPAAGSGAAQATAAVVNSQENATPARAETTQNDPVAANPSAAETPAAQHEAVATTLNPQVAEAPKASAVETPAPAVRESIAATVNPVPAPAVAEPFWFAVNRPQNVIDEKTRQFAFKLAPGAWILALEDRGNSFVVQDSHGKTGILLDLEGIERASDSQ